MRPATVQGVDLINVFSPCHRTASASPRCILRSSDTTWVQQIRHERSADWLQSSRTLGRTRYTQLLELPANRQCREIVCSTAKVLEAQQYMRRLAAVGDKHLPAFFARAASPSNSRLNNAATFLGFPRAMCFMQGRYWAQIPSFVACRSVAWAAPDQREFGSPMRWQHG